MQLKEAIYNKCSGCGCRRELISEGEYGCDVCKKRIPSPNSKEHMSTVLHFTVFWYGERKAERMDACCWECVFRFINKIQRTKYKCDYFISLPEIMFDKSRDAGGYKKFLSAARSVYGGSK